MPGLKARLIEAHWQVRGLDEQGHLYRSQDGRNGANPRWRARRIHGLSASSPRQPQKEPQCNSAKNNRQHELSKHRDKGSARSRQRNARDICRDHKAVCNTTFEWRWHRFQSLSSAVSEANPLE